MNLQSVTAPTNVATPMEILKLPESIKDVDINLDDIDRELLWLNLPNGIDKAPKVNISKKRKATAEGFPSGPTECQICNLKRKMISDIDWSRLRMGIVNPDADHYACLDCGKHLCQIKGWETHRLIHVRKK